MAKKEKFNKSSKSSSVKKEELKKASGGKGHKLPPIA